MLPRLAFFIAVGILLAGCVYEPVHEFINPIQPPAPLQVTVDLMDPDFFSDPYELNEPTTFSFTVSSEKPVAQFEIYVNEVLVEGHKAEEVSFTLDPSKYPHGTHQVTIRVWFKTDSGSLADLLNSEYFVSENTFNFIVDRTAPQLTGNLTAGYESGRLTIRWNGLKGRNFTLRLVHGYETEYLQYFDDSFVDQGYVGGTKEYTLSAHGLFGAVSLGKITFTDQPIDFKVVKDNRFIKLLWTKSLIATQEVYVSVNDVEFPLAATGDRIIDTLSLGEQFFGHLRCYRKGYDQQAVDQVFEIFTQPNFKPHNFFVTLPKSNKLIVCNESKVYRYRLPDLIIEDSLSNEQFDGSAFGSMVANETQMLMIVVCGTRLIGLNPLNFKEHQAYDGLFEATVDASGSDEINDIILGNLSNTGLLTMLLQKQGRIGIAYDLIENTVKWHSPFYSFGHPKIAPSVSDDNQYLTFDDPLLDNTGYLYKWDGIVYKQVGIVASGYKSFRSTINELINISATDNNDYMDGTVSVYNLAKLPTDPAKYLKTSRSVTFPYDRWPQFIVDMRYDPISEMFYTRYVDFDTFSNSTLTLYDINSFVEQNQLRSGVALIYKHHYSYNYHFTADGYIEQAQ